MTTATAAAAMTHSARTAGGYPLRYREKRGTPLIPLPESMRTRTTIRCGTAVSSEAVFGSGRTASVAKGLVRVVPPAGFEPVGYSRRDMPLDLCFMCF